MLPIRPQKWLLIRPNTPSFDRRVRETAYKDTHSDFDARITAYKFNLFNNEKTRKNIS